VNFLLRFKILKEKRPKELALLNAGISLRFCKNRRLIIYKVQGLVRPCWGFGGKAPDYIFFLFRDFFTRISDFPRSFPSGSAAP
jgi:hypothetical protein